MNDPVAVSFSQIAEWTGVSKITLFTHSRNGLISSEIVNGERCMSFQDFAQYVARHHRGCKVPNRIEFLQWRADPNRKMQGTANRKNSSGVKAAKIVEAAKELVEAVKVRGSVREENPEYKQLAELVA